MRRSKVDLIVFVIVIVPTFCATTKKPTPATTTTAAAAVDMIDVQLGAIGVHNLVPSLTSSTQSFFFFYLPRFKILIILLFATLILLEILSLLLSTHLTLPTFLSFSLSFFLSFFPPFSLLREGIIAELMKETDDVASRRKACKEMKELLQRALL